VANDDTNQTAYTLKPLARCIVSSHTCGLSQIMRIWTSCAPISKFGDLGLQF
jgi:hypothetical protein